MTNSAHQEANSAHRDRTDTPHAAGMFPGSMLGEETSRPVPRSDGTTDLYVAPDSFHDIFCQDVPAPQATRMAATQRPATQEALTEPSGERPLATVHPILEAAARPVAA